MSIFNRKKQEQIEQPVSTDLPPLDESFKTPPKKPSYIEITNNRKGQSYIRIKGANHKKRLISETYYTGRNATRAAQALAAEFGLEIVDRRTK